MNNKPETTMNSSLLDTTIPVAIGSRNATIGDMSDLTGAQVKVLEYVTTRIGTGFSPTLREISAEFGWSTHAAAAHHLTALQKKGYLKRKTHLSRGIELVYKP